MDAEGPGDRRDGSRNRWLPQLTRASTWLLATVVAAVIGVVVQGYLGGWLPGVDGGDGARQWQP